MVVGVNLVFDCERLGRWSELGGIKLCRVLSSQISDETQYSLMPPSSDHLPRRSQSKTKLTPQPSLKPIFISLFILPSSISCL